MATWEVWLCDPTGYRLALLDQAASFACTKVRNGIGAAVMVLPTVYDSLIGLDSILEFWRRPDGGALKLFGAYFMRKWRYQDDQSGAESTIAWGWDGNYLLSGRIVASASESAQALMTAELDDMIKAIATDTVGGDAGAGRDLTSVGAGVTIAANLTAAPSATKAFAWQNVLSALVDICNASRAAGTNLYFDVVPSFTSAGLIAWKVETFTGQRGTDHGWASGHPVYFGRQWGNLQGGYYEEDYFDEANYIYGEGQGTKATRIAGTASDTTRSGSSIWNRREAYCNASIGGGGASEASVTADAQAMLEQSRPRITAGGQLLDTPQARYDIDFTDGDVVGIEQRGKQFDAEIAAVGFSVDESGEQQDFRVEVVL